MLRFQADIAAGLPTGTTITNTGVVTWNTPPQTASASVSIDVGGMPGIGMLNGTVWHDSDYDDALGGSELALQGWTVELVRNGAVVQTTLTDAAGAWTLSGIVPNDQNGDQLVVRFLGPGPGAASAALGLASSAFTNGLQQISNVVVTPGSNLQDLNLPIDPKGGGYESRGRAPFAGGALSARDAGGRARRPPN